MLQRLLSALLILSSAGPPADSEKTFDVDKDKVYFGSAESFKSPGTIERDKVFAQITAYKQIQKEGLNESHARYWILLQKANEVFKKAIEKVAADKSYDLIAESGSVKPKGKSKKTAPDATQDAIDAVKEVEKEKK